MLDWYPNAVHSFIYAAIEKGYFKEEGVKVNIKFPSNPTDPLTLAVRRKSNSWLILSARCCHGKKQMNKFQ